MKILASSQLREDFTYSDRDQLTNVKRYTDTAGASLKSESVIGYDDAGKTTSILHKNGSGTTVDSFTYTWDKHLISLETSTLGATNTYAYDASDQVVSDGSEAFSWDPNGNRNNSGYTIGTGNRLTNDGTWEYSYDDAGNVIEKEKSGEYWFYGYDHNNRLTHIEKRTTEGGSAVLTIDFKYDIFGNRIQRDYDADGAGGGAASILKMAYEHGNAWADLQNDLTLTIRRVFTGGLDSLQARIAGGGNEDWYLTDLVGSVRDMVDYTGAAIYHADYSVFGTPQNETNPSNGDRYKYTNREWEAEAQIQYNRARYLQYGRWMSQDPLGFDAGDSNLYRYVRNNPIVNADPPGLSPDTVSNATMHLGRGLSNPGARPPREVDPKGHGIIEIGPGAFHLKTTPLGDRAYSPFPAPPGGGSLVYGIAESAERPGKQENPYGDGFYVSYRGSNAANIRWIQFMKFEYWEEFSIGFAGAPRKVTFKEPTSGKSYTTSDGVDISYFLDTADNGQVYYHDPQVAGKGKTFAGDLTNVRSSIYDTPSALAHLREIMKQNPKAGLVGGWLDITFDDYAIDIKTNKVMAHVSWSTSAYSDTLPLGVGTNFSRAFAFGELDIDANAFSAQNQLLKNAGFPAMIR